MRYYFRIYKKRQHCAKGLANWEYTDYCKSKAEVRRRYLRRNTSIEVITEDEFNERYQGQNIKAYCCYY